MNPQAEQAALADLNAAAERIWEAASPACPALSIEVLPSVGSTNTELLERGRHGQTSPTLIVALEQTAGRGRHGRRWQAAPGQSLTFSLGLPMRLDAVPGGGSALSLAVGLHVAMALDAGLASLHGARNAEHPKASSPPPSAAPFVGLKWPNDLWLQGRKLGGILIEASHAPGLAEGQRWVVVGIGINLGSQHAPSGAIALDAALEPGQAQAMPPPKPLPAPLIGLGQVWSWLAPALLAGVQDFEQQGFAPLCARYGQRDVLRGQAVTLHHPGQPPAQPAWREGMGAGVSESGALLVHTAQGQLQSWTSGEVSVRLACEAPAS